MKTKTIIWYIVIGVVVYYLIYKAYSNYRLSGNIFNIDTTLGRVTTQRYYNDYPLYTNTYSQRVSPFVATNGQNMNGHNH